jgi:hypothetical protein
MNCLRCNAESTISVCLVLSTKGHRPRLQKSSKALQLCGACIRNLQSSDGRELWPSVRNALKEAYTAMNEA